MQILNFRQTFSTALLLAVTITIANGQKPSLPKRAQTLPRNVLLRILHAEDQRRWDQTLSDLLADPNPSIRKRSALALGRIGDERAEPALIEALKSDRDGDVRQMIAFALGEIESAEGAAALFSILDDTRESGAIRARAVEALGKIGAALLSAASERPTSPKTEDMRLGRIRLAVLEALRFEAGRRSMANRETILLGLTAALRVRPEGAGAVIIKFLHYSDPRIVADALNAMARLRLKDGKDEVRQLLSNGDPIVRANAARVSGAAEDKDAYDALLDRALKDSDVRVRVSAIRALGSLKDDRSTLPLLRRGIELFRNAHLDPNNGMARNEGIEILNVLGVLLAGKLREANGAETAARIELSLSLRSLTNENIPEEEVSLAKQNPAEYLDYLKGLQSGVDHSSNNERRQAFYGFRSVSARATGLAELGRIKPQPPEAIKREAQAMLLRMLNDRRTPQLSLPSILNAYALFKPDDLSPLLRRYLKHTDVVVRGTAADLLGEGPPDEINTQALIEALAVAFRDKDLNDAALSILDALAKQKSTAANEAIMSALNSTDYIVRRRAVALLKTNGAGDVSDRIGTVKTRNTEADYVRAIARIGKTITATVVTSKGPFTIEFFPEQAPLTIDNFVQLARRGYFNGQTVPRVVPNFVIQTGDPRGDQNGGPGYQIRCEINEAPFDRGAVGMALSGKDTGGSQWFVTHSPQPHLDGGYTVFGRVISGMEVVDKIVRGDTITRVIVSQH